jgi:hypothetical protein
VVPILYIMYSHAEIENKNILQLRTSLLNAKSQIRQARSSKLNSMSNLLSGLSRNEPSELVHVPVVSIIYKSYNSNRIVEIVFHRFRM